jgi:apolipoprotein N-acyltransferase
VCGEWLRGWVFSGFPWVLVGTSQVRWLPIAQTVSLFGVWGLSALIVAVNVAIVLLLLRERRERPRALLVVALACALSGWGAWRLSAAPTAGNPTGGRGAGVGGPSDGATLRVGIVQGNVPQDQKWSREFADDILVRYIRLSREAAQQGARLIVWPESATPFFFEEDPAGGEAIRLLARETGAWLLFGSDQLERGATTRYYNAAFLVSPDGRTAGVYRKQHLVPFGEYVPLKRLLFFVGPLVEAVSDFSPGTGTAMLTVDGRPVSTAICYEVIFPSQTRAGVVAGSELLTTITNDAWYGLTSAPWQHFEQAAVRSIELGRYLVRAANTGVSGIVDPFGRVVVQRALFETTVLVDDVRFLKTRTLYSTIGDSFAWASAAIGLLVLVRRRPDRAARA